MLNETKVQLASSQKHLFFILVSTLDFIEHIDNKINRCSKSIGMMKRRSLAPTRKILLKIYNKNNPSLMLKDTKMQFATSQKNLVEILDSRNISLNI